MNNFSQLRLNYASWCLLKVLSVLMSLLFGVSVNNVKLKWIIFTIAFFDNNNTRIPIFSPYVSLYVNNPRYFKIKKAIITPQKLQDSGCLLSNDAIMEMAIIDKTSKGSIITNYAVTQLPF